MQKIAIKNFKFLNPKRIKNQNENERGKSKRLYYSERNIRKIETKRTYSKKDGTQNFTDRFEETEDTQQCKVQQKKYGVVILKWKQQKTFEFKYKLRKTISQKLKFYSQSIEQKKNRLISQNFIQKMKEPLRVITLHSPKFWQILSEFSDVFANDFTIEWHDIMISLGCVSETIYVFLTNSVYNPYSLCCNSQIYFEIKEVFTKRIRNLNDFLESKVKYLDNGKKKEDNAYKQFRFLCPKCSIARIVIKKFPKIKTQNKNSSYITRKLKKMSLVAQARSLQN